MVIHPSALPRAGINMPGCPEPGTAGATEHSKLDVAVVEVRRRTQDSRGARRIRPSGAPLEPEEEPSHDEPDPGSN